MNLAMASVGRDNNLNLLRFVAAFAVLVSHAWPIAKGPGTIEPLEPWIGHSLGWAAVVVFFALSGFLITGSWARRPDILGYAMARGLRLFPALAVVVTVTALVLGPMLTSLSQAEYWGSGQIVPYVLRNLTLAHLQYDLPGVFTQTPYPGAINGSLWTLFYEVLCYAGVLALGCLGLIRGRMTAILIGAAGLYLVTGLIDLPAKAALLRGLALPFALGMAAWVWRDRIVLRGSWALVLLALAYGAQGWPGATELTVLALAYGAAVLAYVPGGALRGWNRLGDYSYGIYIWAFPVQQTVMHLFGPMTPWQNILWSSGPVLILAILSWHLIERPALAIKPKAARRGVTTPEASPTP